MEVILLERVEKLGQIGKIVTVKDGYARNFLLPQKKALRATKANIARFEDQRHQIEARNLDLRREAEEAAVKLDGQRFVIIRQAAESGALYGSVTPRDIVEAALESGFTLFRNQILLIKPMKELGNHPVKIVLHPEVSVEISVNVARSVEEAALQAEGKSIAAMRAEEDAKADFDVATLFAENAAANAAERMGDAE